MGQLYFQMELSMTKNEAWWKNVFPKDKSVNLRQAQINKNQLTMFNQSEFKILAKGKFSLKISLQNQAPALILSTAYKFVNTNLF